VRLHRIIGRGLIQRVARSIARRGRQQSSHDEEQKASLDHVASALADTHDATRGSSASSLYMASSRKRSQALGIKLSRERRAGKNIPPPPRGRYSEKTRRKAIRDLEVGRTAQATA
jgi:hypothetical protein